MTQILQETRKNMEFSSLFLSLDEQAREQILVMLRSLAFAQSVSEPCGDHGVLAVKS